MKLSSFQVTLSAIITLSHFTSAARIPANYRACPLLGQQYTSPVKLSTHRRFQAATTSLERALLSNPTYGLNETSLSIGMFSTSEESLVYQYHHSDALLSNSSQGTRKVDADSIYRIGSISKLLTMYMFLIHDGDKHFNDPIADHVPALLAAADESWNPVTPDWTEITIGDLAGQMAGLARDFGLADFAQPDNYLTALDLGKAFPKLSPKEVPTCGYLSEDGTYPQCSLQDYVDGVTSESPIFPTAYTPVYSNEAFALIGIALANIAGSTQEDLFNSGIVDALGLQGTSYTIPEKVTSHDVIPGSQRQANWNYELGIFGPAGGYFSSTNDMAAIGRAMLNSTLLPRSLTRRWMKPSSFVESFDQGVGRPWEIFRVKVNGQSVDLYTKAGDWGVYATAFFLVPQYDFGFTILTATNPGTQSGPAVRNDLPNKIVDIILPVLDAIAKEQSGSTFGGHYASTTGNSSLTISTDRTNSDLIVTQWVSNSIDMLGKLFTLAGPDVVLRIVPNQLDYGQNKVGFTGYYIASTPPPSNGTFYLQCPGWLDVDELTYGNIPIGQMVFDLGSDGQAGSVELRALRTTLERST